MSSYMLLIIEPPAQRATRTEAQGREAYARMQAFGDSLRQQGKLQAGAALASQTSAVRVSGVHTSPRVLDGPFSEAKEMVGGFLWSTAPTWTRRWHLPSYARPLSGPRWKYAPWHPVTTTSWPDQGLYLAG